jgi:hypothetical protein
MKSRLPRILCALLFSSVLAAQTPGKENRMERLVDLQIAAELPVIE